MGCCQSREDAASSPALPQDGNHFGAHDSSQAAIVNHASSTNRETVATTSSRLVAPNAAAASVKRPNKPLELPSPLAKSPKNTSNVSPPWTSSHLERERQIFFETRVTGRKEVWDALRVICEYLRHGELQEAQALFDAVGMTCPYGKFARSRHVSRSERGKEGVYDERGQLYDIPPWVVVDPQDIIEDEGKDVDGADDDEDEDITTAEAAEAERRRAEKGKGRADDIGEEIRLRARLSDRASDIEITLGSKQNVSVATRMIMEQSGTKNCRLLLMGKTLDGNRTLDAQGWKPGQVVNAFVPGWQ